MKSERYGGGSLSTTLEPVEVRSDYACVDHPVLTPEAWHQVRGSKVVGEGVYAALVCQFACAARDRCPFTEGVETVAAGGWFNQFGKFIKMPEGTIELHQAAAYIGLNKSKFAYQLQRNNIRCAGRFHNHGTYATREIKALAERLGPEHGTPERAKLHQVLGQECRYCRS